MSEEDWTKLQIVLLTFFDNHNLKVAVGLKPGGGIVIRSQDEHVDAENLGEVKPQGFPDTGPGEDGRRNTQQWLNAISEDMSIAFRQLRETIERPYAPDKALKLALARKELNRALSDVYRFGEEVHSISREEIDSQGPL